MLVKALKELPMDPEVRRVLALHYLLDLSAGGDIAAETGANINTIKSWLSAGGPISRPLWDTPA